MVAAGDDVEDAVAVEIAQAHATDGRAADRDVDRVAGPEAAAGLSDEDLDRLARELDEVGETVAIEGVRQSSEQKVGLSPEDPAFRCQTAKDQRASEPVPSRVCVLPTRRSHRHDR